MHHVSPGDAHSTVNCAECMHYSCYGDIDCCCSGMLKSFACLRDCGHMTGLPWYHRCDWGWGYLGESLEEQHRGTWSDIFIKNCGCLAFPLSIWGFKLWIAQAFKKLQPWKWDLLTWACLFSIYSIQITAKFCIIFPTSWERLWELRLVALHNPRQNQ